MVVNQIIMTVWKGFDVGLLIKVLESSEMALRIRCEPSLARTTCPMVPCGWGVE
jgi:hypothetical protein